MQKGTFHPMNLQDKYKPIKDMSLQGSTNPITTLLTGEPMELEYQEDGKIIIKFVKSEENEADIFTKNTTNVIFNNHQKKLVWDKANVESELIQELDQSENQQEGC